MNKLEAAYALILEARKRNGEIADYAYESVTLKLATGVRYTPDFVVWREETLYGTWARIADVVELHEVKGFMRDDARIKLRVAAKQFPYFTFRLCRRLKGSWTIEEVTP